MSYQRKVLLTASLLLSGLIVATDVAQAAPRIEATATIGFKAPTKLDLALSEAQRREINVESIRVEQKERVEDFYIGDKDQSKVANITNEYWKSYGTKLQDLLYEPEGPDPRLKEDPRVAAANMTYRRSLEQERKRFVTEIQGCWKTNTCPEVTITEMRVVGNANNICQLKQLPSVNVVSVITFEASRIWFSDCDRKILLPPHRD